MFFEQVRAVQWRVRLFERFERGGLLVGQVFRVFQQRPARTFHEIGSLLVATTTFVVLDLSADFVDCVLRPAHDVKRIETDLNV